jgi:hypothetical protein
MQWHRKFTQWKVYGSVLTKMGVCQGCVYGSMHQTHESIQRSQTHSDYTWSMFCSRCSFNSVTALDINIVIYSRKYRHTSPVSIYKRPFSAWIMWEKTRQLFHQTSWNASRTQSRFIRLTTQADLQIHRISYIHPDSIGLLWLRIYSSSWQTRWRNHLRKEL